MSKYRGLANVSPGVSLADPPSGVFLQIVVDEFRSAATMTVTMDASSDPVTDRELVERSLAGDHAAFGSLYDRYARMVRAVAAGSARGTQEIDDLSQEAFLRAFQKLSELQDPRRFRTWLFGIARNVARERRRQLARDRHKTHAAELLDQRTIGCPDELELTEETDVTLSELTHLPEDEALAMRLYFLEEFDARQTAETLGLSRSGVYAMLQRATQRLGEAVSKRLCERKPT